MNLKEKIIYNPGFKSLSLGCISTLACLLTNLCFYIHVSKTETLSVKVFTFYSLGCLFLYFLQVPIPALKEQIATVTGVLSEQQRLICRGKVLKDDQLLSAYRILF